MEGFKTKASSCTAQRIDLVTDAQSILNQWREHFTNLQNGELQMMTMEQIFNCPSMKQFECQWLT